MAREALALLQRYILELIHPPLPDKVYLVEVWRSDKRPPIKQLAPASPRGHPIKSRISVFCAYYPSHGGGMELSCERLVNDLYARGHTVRWLAQQDGCLPDIPPELCVPLSGTDVVYQMSGVPAPLLYPSAMGRIVDEISASDLVIIVEANFLISVLAYGAARARRKKVMLVQHVGEPSTLSRLARLVMRGGEAVFTRRMVRNADAVVFVSRSVGHHFEGIRNKNPTRIIGHAIDVDLFNTAPSTAAKQADRRKLGLPVDATLACFVGRITESKGISVLRHLATMMPGMSFAIAGQGPVNPAGWGLPNVFVLGQLSQSQVAQLYRCSDELVLPSQSESFSLVVREAMACGCKVVCADQILETDPRLENYISTVPVDLDNPRQTAQAFAAAIKSPREVNAVEARNFIVDECSEEKIRAQYLSLVDQLITKPGTQEL